MVAVGNEVDIICHNDLEEITKLFFVINNLIEK